MRRVILNLLRCPRCRRGALLPEADTQDLVFGPIRCAECQGIYPVAEGVADLVGDRSEPSLLQRNLERPWVARSFERHVRPLLSRAVSRQRLDGDSEFLMYRALLGNPSGPALDLGCGTGLFSRRLARELPASAVVGMDVARPMLEEGVAQARENGVMVDFVRAEAPELPFADHSFGAVLQSASLHLIGDASRLFLEVGRVLRPGGHYVASTYLPPPFPRGYFHRQAGLHPRTEEDLRAAVAAAGLVQFERVRLPPMLVLKAEKPAVA